MKNIEYTVDEQESPFDVVTTDASFKFPEYEDPRGNDYYESTIPEYEEYDEPTITDNNDEFYDTLESEFEAEKGNDEYHYLKMKKGYVTKEEVGDVLKSTNWSPSNTVTITSLEDVLWSRDDEYQQAA